MNNIAVLDVANIFAEKWSALTKILITALTISCLWFSPIEKAFTCMLPLFPFATYE
jgi:hypothetical protein